MLGKYLHVLNCNYDGFTLREARIILFYYIVCDTGKKLTIVFNEFSKNIVIFFIICKADKRLFITWKNGGRQNTFITHAS